MEMTATSTAMSFIILFCNMITTFINYLHGVCGVWRVFSLFLLAFWRLDSGVCLVYLSNFIHPI